MQKLIFLFILICFLGQKSFAQENLSYTYVDSISYNQYLSGQWDNLIQTGKQAISENIDFKRLRQRIGYAYFIKGDYYASQYQYEKALKFDDTDQDTRLYLYYCGINTGDLSNARYHARFLNEETKTNLNIKSFKLIDAIDLEYNIKTNNDSTRSNPTYKRIGLNSKLGYRLNLYQAFSNYNQSFSKYIELYNLSYNYNSVQNEYFASLNYLISKHTNLTLAYHYINANVDNTYYPGNIFHTQFQTHINRFDIGLSASNFISSIDSSLQIGLHTGYVVPGKMNLYLKNSTYYLNNITGNRIIFSQSIGALVIKKVWAEGNVTLGDLNNYIDKGGLYVYNSLDKTIFRTGLSLFWNTGKKITIFGNYSFDKKTNNDSFNTYNQHSISGGLIWKF